MTVLKIILQTILLAGNFIATLPLLYFRHRQGVKVFTSELVKSGMDKEKARELAEEYKGYSHELRKIFNNMMKHSAKKADD